MSNKRKLGLAILAIGIGPMVGVWLLFKKIQRDRQAALAPTPSIPHVTITHNKNGQTETRTYNASEIKTLRREGKLPLGARQPNMPLPPNSAGEDATQRALKTLNDINRINEMNQRLMDQQERARRQK